MDHNAVFDIFKKQYMTDGYFPFSLFPILFLELIKYGADKDVITKIFISDFLATFLPKDSPAIHVKAIDCIEHYKKEFLPTPIKKTEITKKPAEYTQKVEVSQAVEQPKSQITPIKTVISNNPPKITYDGYIPTDAEEGDGTYIPEDQRLYFKPEECASKQYDWDFIKRIGAVVEENE